MKMLMGLVKSNKMIFNKDDEFTQVLRTQIHRGTVIKIRFSKCLCEKQTNQPTNKTP